ncbi:hypothetical protein F5141DRAFT_1205048 [Pisolithus sp. B1]|nr:hypothetical protein F5141DRAFT_1205048 [Pisolithus sp. B1]
MFEALPPLRASGFFDLFHHHLPPETGSKQTNSENYPQLRTTKRYLEHYSLSRPVIQHRQENRPSWADYDEEMEFPLEEFEDTRHHSQHPMTDPGLTHQEAMEELGIALDKALYALKAISDHASFPADFTDKATSIYEKVTGLSHGQPQPIVNSNQDIVSALTKLT